MRAGGFASVCVVLSKAGHDLMASRPAPAWSGWIALAAVSAVGYCLADRRRPLWWILLAVEVAQTCLHLWFTWSTPPNPGAAPGRLGVVTHGGMHHLSVAGTPAGMSHGGGMSAGMWGVHALAGLLVALWLYAGERALWHALAAIVGSLVGRTLRSLRIVLSGGLGADRAMSGANPWRGEDETPPALEGLRHALVRRGPPRPVGMHFM
ncbi:hypothetical protein GCM10023191_038970 [Actinoallomurus oryzae]|uniref:Uncharacterized protein n=1 Tax=Actinoallomurus oryzae TaxID=502180 RepID=A0ABP8Q4S7_9ACTN